MKILISFFNQKLKNNIINLFTDMNIKNNNQCLLIDNTLKIDYSQTKLNCYCYDIKIADKILDSLNYLDEVEHIMINTTIYDFNAMVKLAHKGTLKHLNTEQNELSFELELCDYLYAIINVKDCNAVLELKFTVSDHVKHPLIYIDILNNYFDFQNEKTIHTYKYYYKYLYSANGFKKYSKYLNLYPNYKYNGLSYKYILSNGYLKFVLNDVELNYPNVIEFKSNDIQDIDIIKQLNKFFNINTIQEITITEGLNYTIEDLLKDNYVKNDNFFEYIKTIDYIKYIYDIYKDELKIIKNIIL